MAEAAILNLRKRSHVSGTMEDAKSKFSTQIKMAIANVLKC